MRSFSTLLIASAFAGFASALGNQTIDPNSVDFSTRSQWCLAENNNCPLLCPANDQVTFTCDPTMLKYQCICGNGSSPDVAAYKNTLPYFICQEYVAQCVNGHPNDADGQHACREYNPCGTLDPQDAQVASSTSSSSAAASSTAPPSSTSSAPSATSASATPSASQKAHNAAAGLSLNYATAIFGAAMLAACGALL